MSRQPNILLITTDQQRYDTIAAMGYDYMYTPNLDRLVREGCSFPNAYSPNPVCMAARHNIITGLPARYHGFDDNYFDDNPKVIPYDLPTFPQLLSDAGYDTIAVGKMHFQPYRRHNGITKLELMDEIPRHRQDDEYALYLKEHGYGDIQSIHGVRHLLYMLPQRSMLPEELHGSSWVSHRSIHHIKENAGKRPFFLWSSFIAPHPPFDVPDQWADLYKGKELPPLKVSTTPLSALAEENKNIADYPTEAYLRRARELYFASISFVDYNIGKILQQLEDMGEYDNTLIIFTSDHGEMLGDYGTYQKFLPYDSSARVPLIVRYPEVFKGGEVDRRFVDLNDILPTVLDAAGVAYPNPAILPGESVLKKSGFKDRTKQYVEHAHGSRRWASIRNGQYKYTYYYGGGKEELFDMINDPDETTNLLAAHKTCEGLQQSFPSESVSAVREELHAALVEQEKRYGLEGYVKNDELVVLDEMQPFFYRENNPPMFPKEQDEDFVSLEEEVARAIAKEEVVKLSELDVPYFTKSGTLSEEKLKK